MRKPALIFALAGTAVLGALIAFISEQQRKIDFLSSQVVLLPTPSVAVEEKSPAPKGRQAAASKAQPEMRNLRPTATEVFHLQSECVEMGKRILENNLAYIMETEAIKQGKAPPYDVKQVAHYNVKDNHCYVELSSNDTGEQRDSVREVYDGQTGELLASCLYRFEKPLLCNIFKPERVPESAYPESALPRSYNAKIDWGKVGAEQVKAYIDYVMEGN